MIDESFIPVKNEKVRDRSESFGKLLLLAGLPMLCINKDAERIWQLCDGKHSIKDIALICQQDGYEGGITEKEKAISLFLEEALRLGLVSPVNPTHGSSNRDT